MKPRLVGQFYPTQNQFSHRLSKLYSAELALGWFIRQINRICPD
jgi:hypothetical protein